MLKLKKFLALGASTAMVALGFSVAGGAGAFVQSASATQTCVSNVSLQDTGLAKYVTVGTGPALVASATSVGASEKFNFCVDNSSGDVYLQGAANSKWVTYSTTNHVLTASAATQTAQTAFSCTQVGGDVELTALNPTFGASPVFTDGTLGSDVRVKSGNLTQTAYATTATCGTSSMGMAGFWTQFSNGPDPTGNPNYVMVGVWDQAPDRQNGGVDNAITYKGLGINTDVNAYENTPGTFAADGWEETGGIAGTGPDGLASPYTFASDNNEGNFLDDEPDMNQINEAPNNQRTSIKFAAEGSAVKAADTTRPSAANFGKCVSLYVTEGGWPGCHLDNESPMQPNDLALIQQYCSGIDVASSDYYGYTDPYEPTAAHGAWTYGTQVDGTRLACGANKPVLGFVETGHPFNNAGAATITPTQLGYALNVELVHGANGFVYFVHDFYSGGFTEDGLLNTETTAKPVVAAFDAEVSALADWINQVSLPGVTTATTGGVPVTTMLKTYQGHTYLFAAADGSATMTGSGSTTATFTLPSGTYSATSAVYGESRSVNASSGSFSDSFSPYQLHVYELS